MNNSIRAILFSLLFSSIATAQISLSYQTKVGDTYSTTLSMAQNIKQSMMGTDQAATNEQVISVDFKTNSSSDGLFTSDLLYKRVIINQNSPMGTTGFDSQTSGDDIPPALRGYASLVDKGYQISFDKTGAIQSVSGVNAMINGMVEELALPTEEAKSSLKANLVSQFNDETMKSQIQNSLIIYPKGKINTGSTWVIDQSVSAPYPLNISTTYTLKDYDTDFAYITVSSAISSGENSNMSLQGAEVQFELKGTQTGSVKVDRKTGFILESNLEQNTSGLMKVISPQQMDIPMELKGVISIKGAI